MPYAHDFPGVGVAAEIVLPVNKGGSYYLHRIWYSYDSKPTGGSLAVINGDGEIFRIDVTSDGPDTIEFAPLPMGGEFDSKMIVRLESGGIAVNGKLNIYYE